MANREDLRVKKTRIAIRSAFEEMLMEMDYEKITVKELCERAMINRKTFYSHYAYLDILLDEYISEIADNYLIEVGPSCGFDELPRRIERFFRYLPNVPALAEKLVMSSNGLGFFRRIGAMILEKEPDEIAGIEKVPGPAQKIILDYLYNACLTIYRGWVEGGKCLSSEELAELAVTLICGDVNSLLQYLGA